MRWIVPAALIGICLTWVTSAAAEDLSTSLASAEQEVASTEAEVSARQQQLEKAGGKLGAAAADAAPYVRALNRNRSEVQRLRAELSKQEEVAGSRIARLTQQHQEEVEAHDKEVREGIGFGLAALVAAAIALAWGWFRATEAVAALTRLELGQAIGLCLGGGLLLLIVGAVLGGSDGAMGALGSFLFCLGLILPTAFLLARHSAEVQRGRSRPLLRRERLPAWTSIALAGLMLVVFLASTGSAIFADDASSEPISAQLRRESDAASQGPGAEAIEAAQAAVAKAEQAAAGPLSRREAASAARAAARDHLQAAQRQLASARSNERTFAKRLVALEAKEQREVEQEEKLAAIEEEELIEQEENERAAECNPNYSGCLDPYSPDYDCAGGSGNGPDYTGTVEVLGYDEYELDDDGDGIGCDLG
jgi:hypothetical protein